MKQLNTYMLDSMMTGLEDIHWVEHISLIQSQQICLHT